MIIPVQNVLLLQVFVSRHVVDEGVVEEKGAAVETGEEFPCKMCGKISTSKSRLKTHIRSCHDIPEDCEVCGKTFSSRKYARSHTRDVHTDRSLKCPNCPNCFKNRRTLKVHMKTCGRWRVQKKQQLKLKCTMCLKLFPSNPCLRKHVWKHHQLLLHNPAPSLRSRRQELFASRRPKNWMSVSSACSTRKDNLATHSSRRHQVVVQLSPQEQLEELLVCGFQDCTFTSRRKRGLIKHKHQVHKGEKAFICNLCNHTFTKNSDMLQHGRRMHKGLAIKCRGEDGVSGCGKYFKRQDNMTRHLRACGAPLHKPWLLLGPSQKTKRTKQKANKFRAELDAMEKDERKAYIRAVVQNNPDFLDSQTTNPFKTEDVIQVRSVITNFTLCEKAFNAKNDLRFHPIHIHSLQFLFQMIRDEGLTDRQCLGICTKMRRHWKQGVPPRIQKALVEKKKLLDNFYTKVSQSELDQEDL